MRAFFWGFLAFKVVVLVIAVTAVIFYGQDMITAVVNGFHSIMDRVAHAIGYSG